MQDVVVDRVARAQHAIGEDVRMRTASLARNRVHSFDVLGAEVVERDVRRLRADRVGLLADDEEKREVVEAARPQPLPRRDHRGDDALRVARAAAVDPVVILGKREPRRHGVDVRIEHDARPPPSRREEVEAIGRDVLCAGVVAKARQLVAKKRAIDQQRDGNQRYNASEDGPPVPIPRGESEHNGRCERQQIEQKEEKRFAVFRAAQRRTKRGHHEVVTCSLGRAE